MAAGGTDARCLGRSRCDRRRPTAVRRQPTCRNARPPAVAPLPTGADLTVPEPRRDLLAAASRACQPTYACGIVPAVASCDTGFSHLDCRSVLGLILIVALHSFSAFPLQGLTMSLRGCGRWARRCRCRIGSPATHPRPAGARRWSSGVQLFASLPKNAPSHS